MPRRSALEVEIGRLETQLDSGPVADELAAVRRGLSARREPAFALPNVRIGFACKQRWEDMRGDARVRACAGCERPVFNLSEMTRDEAERVLATRGLTPCVRFYRRPDGTVMTTDCPTSQKPVRRLAVVASSLALATPSSAEAQPAPDPSEPPSTQPAVVPTTQIDPYTIEMGVMIEPERHAPRSRIGWSIWGRLGMGVASKPSTVAVRASTPTQMVPTSDTITEAAILGDLTVGIARDGDLRVGVWGELRTTSDPVIGGELVVQGLPRHPYRSHGGSVVLRVGGNQHITSGAFGFGFTWSRTDSWAGHLGARLVTSINKSRDVPHDWSATIGIEFAPIGAVQAVLDLAKD